MRLLSVGIRPESESIKPAGNHLRWSLPATHGFPKKGFRVWRRKNGFKPKISKLPHVEKPKQQRIQTDDFIALWQKGSSIVTTTNGYWQLTTSAGEQLLLRFTKPIVFLAITYENASGTNQLTAYRGRQRTTSSKQTQRNNTQTLSISDSYFDHALLTLNFKTLVSISIVTEQEHLALQDWKSIADIPLLQPGDQAAAMLRFEEDLENRYAASRDKAIDRYATDVDSLIKEQHLLLEDTADREFTAQTSTADELSVRPLSARAALSLAATDPNIARLLGLYWVDRDKGENPPDHNQAYDYKVDAFYQTGLVSGLAIDIGKIEAQLPVAPKAFAANQLPGVAWQGRNPLGQAGLYWPDAGYEWSPVQTVFMDVLRHSPRASRQKLLTKKTPLALQRARESKTGDLRFKDKLLPLGRYKYQLRGVDLFGQTGKKSESIECEIKDLGAPPSPVRLQASVTQHGFPWTDQAERANIDPAMLNQGKVTLSFEYGDNQHLQAPDAKFVRLYWRRNEIRERVLGKVEAVQVLESGSELQHIKLLLADISAELANSLIGGAISTVSTQGAALDNVNRRTGRVQSTDDTWLHIEIAAMLNAGDEVEIITDPANRLNWMPIKPEIALRAPIEAKVSTIKKPVVSILNVTQLDEVDLQVASEIANTIPAGVQPETAPPVLRELTINRDLLEPNLFSMAVATAINGSSNDLVQYSTAGHGSGDLSLNTAARLAVDPNSSFNSAQTLTLSGAVSGEDHVGDPIQYLTMDVLLEIPHSAFSKLPSGGEIAFSFNANGNSERVIARVVSSMVDANGLTLCMTKFRLKDLQNHGANLSSAKASYYAPYLLDASIDVSIVAEGGQLPDDEPAWEAQTDLGIFPGFIALTAVDDRAHEGPLSKPVEASAVRPPPLGLPDAPRPCNVAPADIANLTMGKARAPDLHGNATVCLAWSTANITPNQGLRCEMARALDTTIIETDRKNWLQNNAPAGLADNTTTGVIPGQQYAGLSVFDTPSPDVTDNGLVTIVTNTDTASELSDGNQRASFVGGRLLSESVVAGQPQINAFKITKVQPQWQIVGADGSSSSIVGIRWLLQPMARGRTQIGDTVTVESSPDYRQTQQNDQYLATLANKTSNQDAFGIVSGVPFEADSGQNFRFIDELPGLGANRFFYKARAVDAANNHSLWSPASVPIYQTDTRPPPAPQITRVSPGPGNVALHVHVSSNENISGYRLYRANSEDELSVIDPLAEYHHSDSGSLPVFNPEALKSNLGTVDIGNHSALTADVAVGGSDGNRLIEVNRANDNSEPKTNYLVTNQSKLDGDSVIGLNPLLEDGASVVLVLSDVNGHEAVIYRNAQGTGPLTVHQQRVEFEKISNNSQILGVFRRFDFDPGESFDNQPGVNLFVAGSTFDQNASRINGLDAQTAPDQQPVVAIVKITQSDGTHQTLIVEHRFGQLDALRCYRNQDDSLSVDLHLPTVPNRVIGVYREAEFDHNIKPGDQTAFNYAIKQVTTIDLQRGVLTGLNPLLSDGHNMLLELVVDGTTHSIEHKTDSVVLLDSNVPVVQQGNQFAYGIAAVREIQLDSGAPLRVAGPMTTVWARALSTED